MVVGNWTRKIARITNRPPAGCAAKQDSPIDAELVKEAR